MYDKVWEDGDDAELENEAYSAGFSEGKDALAGDMRSMYHDLQTALQEEMEVHDEPSLHLVESVHNWSQVLHGLSILDAEEYDTAQKLLAEAGSRTEVE